MLDSGALMGLIGALSGAAIGAIGAVYGPLVLKKKERHWQELARDDDLYTARITSLTYGRLRTRQWFDYLNLTVTLSTVGEQVDVKEFAETCHKHRSESHDAIYDPVLLRVAARPMRHSVVALQNASDMIAQAVWRSDFAGGQVPSEVTEALEAAATARSWFRTAIERVVEARTGLTAQEFSQRYPSGFPSLPDERAR
ncbi:hypothetical protein ACFC4G_39170 [Streptomyces sp. NPDC056002]|uniref:hypothetical protein n=1 Tax=Streptomyces sp. NPDC056002 TaxID=3345675 RepID=UPI0035D8DDDB